ncbi:MAG: sensor histidine kinase N-terminal domain-containing protein, partial [Candidatus Melainabacteria bacterium]|nr:sensor histidine kinase N-terminal domain-containing protein [Candidatus Melainabacteria bacterium]
MRRSIKKLLLVWLSSVLGGLWIVGTIVGYYLAVKFSNDAYDRELVNSADSVAARMRIKDGRIVVDLPPAAQAVLRYNSVDKFYYQVLKPTGELISGDAVLPRPSQGLEEGVPRFRTAQIGKEKVRIVGIEAPVTETNDVPMIVQVGETLISRQQLSRDIWMSIVVPQLIMVLLGAAAVWFGVGRGLDPLRVLQKAITKRSPSDLSPVGEATAPEEVLPLVQSINDLLGRLRDDIKAQQRFVANAAHQLRTPLAGLKTYSSLGTSLSDIGALQKVMKQIDLGLDRTTHLVNQLLALARMDPGHGPGLHHGVIDLNFIVSDVVAEQVLQAVKKNIDLSFESAPEPAMVSGDMTGLQQLVSNLLDNALVYTPEAGKVSIK